MQEGGIASVIGKKIAFQITIPILCKINYKTRERKRQKCKKPSLSTTLRKKKQKIELSCRPSIKPKIINKTVHLKNINKH